uniref:Uncharacterized protein n=1 Tax=Cacopsylla melanoneura TaxID=428564 RepID=A0A8D8SK61_9HEMI
MSEQTARAAAQLDAARGPIPQAGREDGGRGELVGGGQVRPARPDEEFVDIFASTTARGAEFRDRVPHLDHREVEKVGRLNAASPQGLCRLLYEVRYPRRLPERGERVGGSARLFGCVRQPHTGRLQETFAHEIR